jgi:hypothetical protein
MRIAGRATFICPALHLQLDSSKKCWLVHAVDPHIGAVSLRGLPTAGNVRAVEPCSGCWLG